MTTTKTVRGDKVEVTSPPIVFDKFFAVRERDKLDKRRIKLLAQRDAHNAEIDRLVAEIADWDDKLSQLP